MILSGGTTTLGVYDFKAGLDDFGKVDYWVSKVSGYPINQRVMLADGTVVQNILDGNVNDPNSNLTGWVKTNNASYVRYGDISVSDVLSKTVTPYDFGAIGDGVAHPLSERYSTLAEAQTVYPFATSLSEYIDGLALQAWWLDICGNTRGIATAHGKFVINTKISNASINNLNNIIKTRRIDFDADIKVSGLTGNAFEIISPRQTCFSGFINIYDANTAYASRTVDVLIYLEDFIYGTFNWRVVAKYAKRYGMLAVSGTGTINGTVANNNTSNLGDWQFGSCGHRFSVESFSFTSRSDTGSSNSTNQRTVLTLSGNHGLTDIVDGFIRYNGKPYLITDFTANTITVYPWITETDTTGTIQVSFGGDFRLIGPDSNNIKMSNGSADCAICAGGEGFYVGAKVQRTNEGNDIGLRLGNSISNAQIGGTYIGTYFELNEFDIVKTSVTADNAVIINPIALNESKCHVLAPISSSTRLPATTLIQPWRIIYGDKVKTRKAHQYYDGLTPNTTITAKLGDELFKLRANTASVTLSDDVNFRRIYGNVDIEFEIFGTASNNGTTGATTIIRETGYTINGSASNLTIPASNSAFKVSARLINETDWRVCVFYAERPSGSKTHDWASLASGQQQSTTVTVFGAAVGNQVTASMDVSLGGTWLNAEVTSTNTVTVYQYNPTGSAVDVVSGTLLVKLL